MDIIKYCVVNVILKPKLCSHWIPRFVQCRGSRYSPRHIPAIFKPEALKQLAEQGALKEKAFVPIKAAENYEHNSVFRDELLNKFMNLVMKDGRKRLARELVEKGLENVKCIQIEMYHKAIAEEKTLIELNPLTIFHAALVNCKPLLELTPVKRGAIVYQVPVPVSDKRARYLAMKWIIEASKEKDKKLPFEDRLASELLDAFKNGGRAIKRKQDLHMQCEANKAYAHFKW